MSKETEKLQRFYDKWMPLVLHIINKHFKWVTTNTGTGSYQKIRRAVDFDDLRQEGITALLDAREKYNPRDYRRASFKTYAFRVIYHRLLAYVDRNCTPITTAPIWQTRKYTEKTREQYHAAAGYSCFSEVSTERHGRTDHANDMPTSVRSISDQEDFTQTVEDTDFREFCLAKLKAELSAEEWKILLLKFEGWTYKEIAGSVGLSAQMVQKIMMKLTYRVPHILHREIEEFGVKRGPQNNLADYLSKTKRRRRPRV